MMLIKKSLLTVSLSLLALHSGLSMAWPGITRGQMVDLDSSEPFNNKCSYRVLLKETGISNEVNMVSSDKLIFDTLIDDPNASGKNQRQVASTFTINANDKMKATGSVIPGPYSSQFQKKLKAGEFEITEHSCVKMVSPDHARQHHKYHHKKEK
ncbi:hypothetical protein [Endozoicomonas sp. OPT23]|uniref:hypothetical protein n=1 Tax=Endozoicomonas sp. OPT23 TaxID=2072845 RepID=UPI0018914084|nr:hypothetical protein [Endozoicomonas sp. OPT23]